MASIPITPEAIRAAHELIAPHIRRTPLIEIDSAELALATGPLALKLELLQHSGSFKVRGAFAKIGRAHV